MKPITKYLCPTCKTFHDTEEEARSCCQQPMRPSFVCPCCNRAHKAVDGAAGCCDIAVFAAELYRLGIGSLDWRTILEVAGDHAELMKLFNKWLHR